MSPRRYAIVTILFLVSFSFIVPPVSLHAQDEVTTPVLTYTLDDCLSIAMRRAPAVLSAAQDVKKARGAIWEVWTSILSVNADGTYTYMDIPSGTTYPANIFGPGIPSHDVFLGYPAQDFFNVGVEGTLPLFTGGRVVSGLAVAYLSDDIAAEGYRKAVNDTLYNVRAAFNGILLAREVVKVRTDSLDLLTKHLETTRKKYDVGVVSKFDVLRSEVEVANARPPLIAAKKDLVTAEESLKRVLGIDVSDPFEVTGELTFVEEPADLDALLTEAEERSPELIISRKTERIAGKKVTMAAGEFLPTITAFGRYEGNFYGSEDVSWNEDDWDWNFTGGVMVSMPLTDLLVSAAKLSQARADYAKARIGALDTSNKVKLDIKTAYYDLMEAREVVESQRLNISQAEEALNIAEVRYENGISTLLELMDTELALTSARLNWLNALYNYEESKARLKKIIGSEGTEKK